MTNLYNVINQLKNTTSLNEKKEILKNNESNLLKKYLKYTYDPLIVWEIKKIPELEKTGNENIEKIIDDLYQKLIQERIRGNEMREYVKNTLEKLSESDQKLITLMLKKDLKCGVNAKLINSVFSNLVFEAEYMGAIKYSEKHFNKLLDEEVIIAQKKMDGEYSNLFINFGSEIDPKFASRKGKIQYMPQKIINDLKQQFGSKIDPKQEKIDQIIFNGELIILGFDRYTSNGLLTRIFKYEEKLNQRETKKKLDKMLSEIEQLSNLKYSELISKIKYVVWDAVINQNKKIAYHKRINTILSIFDKIGKNNFFEFVAQSVFFIKNGSKTDPKLDLEIPIIQDFENKVKQFNFIGSKDEVKEKIQELFTNTVEAGDEGLVVKSAKAFWKNGKPNYQIKMKFQSDCDLKIIDFEPGTPGTKYENTLGVLICESADGKVKVRVGGIDEYWRDQIWNQKEYYRDKIVKVEHNGLSKAKDTNHYSLLHPRFIQVREDKDIADTIDQIKE